MRRKISTIIIAGIMVLASGCQDNGFDFTVTKARIVPVVSSVATTKAAENLPAAPKHIATYTISATLSPRYCLMSLKSQALSEILLCRMCTLRVTVR